MSRFRLSTFDQISHSNGKRPKSVRTVPFYPDRSIRRVHYFSPNADASRSIGTPVCDKQFRNLILIKLGNNKIDSNLDC